MNHRCWSEPDIYAWMRRKPRYGGRVYPINRIHLPRKKRIHPPRTIIHRHEFYSIEPTSRAVFVMALHATPNKPHPWFKAFNAIEASANPVGDRFIDLTRGVDDQVIVGQQIRKIGVPRSQRESHLMVRQTRYVLNAIDNNPRA